MLRRTDKYLVDMHRNASMPQSPGLIWAAGDIANAGHIEFALPLPLLDP